MQGHMALHQKTLLPDGLNRSCQMLVLTPKSSKLTALGVHPLQQLRLLPYLFRTYWRQLVGVLTQYLLNTTTSLFRKTVHMLKQYCRLARNNSLALLCLIACFTCLWSINVWCYFFNTFGSATFCGINFWCL